MKFIKFCTLSGLILAGLFNATSTTHAAEIKVSAVVDMWRKTTGDQFDVKYKRLDESSYTVLFDSRDSFHDGNVNIVEKDIIYLQPGFEYEFLLAIGYIGFNELELKPGEIQNIRLQSTDPSFEVVTRRVDTETDFRQSGWMTSFNPGGHHTLLNTYYRVKLVPRSSLGAAAGQGATPGGAVRTPTVSSVASDFGGDFNGLGGLNFGHPDTGIYLEMALGAQVAGDTAGSMILQAHYINHLFDDLEESLVYAPPLTRFSDTIEILRDTDDSILEILTPEAKVDIAQYVESGSEYIAIRVFENTPGSNLNFDPDATASPELRRWDIVRPENSLNDVDVTYTEYDGSGVVIQTNTSSFERNITNGWWTYTTGGGLYNEKIARSKVGAVTTLTKEVWQGTNTTDKVTTVHEFKDYPWGPELIKRVVDSGGDNLATEYRYYESLLDVENYRYGALRDVRYPNGNWINHEYHKDADQYGMLRYVEQPWLGSPGSPGLISPVAATGSYTNASAIVTETEWSNLKYEYLPGEISTWTTGTKSSRTQFSNAENTITLDGSTIGTKRTTTGAYPGDVPATPVISEVILYDTKDPDLLHLNGRPRVISYPDGRQISFTAKAGTISGNTFTNSATGEDTVEYYIHGVDPDLGVAAGVYENDWQSNDVGDIRLFPGKSFVQELHIDEHGRVLNEFTTVFTTASAWESAGWKVHTYNNRGQLTQTEHSNQLFDYYEYDIRDRLSKYTATDGSVTEYDYDALDRVTEIKRKGVTNSTYGNQSDITTTIAYDTIATSGFGGKRTITTTAGSQTTTVTEIYDAAGRLISSTDGIGLTTTIDYPLGGRNQEITYDDGTTRNLTRYINGFNKWLKGTSVPDSSFTYTIESSGNLRTGFYPDDASQRKAENLYDWMGRMVLEESPAPNPASGTPTDLITTYHYNNEGQLAYVSPTGTNAVLYGYGYMGNLQLVSLDVNDNDTDDASGTDRARLFDYGFYKDGSVIRHYSTESVRPKLNTSVPKEVRKTTTRVHPFDIPGLNAEIWQTDINGNSIVTTTNVDAANKRVDVTTNYPDATNNGIAKLLNGRLVESRTMDNLVYSYKYDGLGNPTEVVDPRKGASYIRYHSNHLQVMERENAAGDIMAYTYESDTGRLASVKDPLGQYSYFSYNDFGQIQRSWGGNRYPVEMGYNSVGDRTTLKTFKDGSGWNASTWPGSAGTPTTTTWTIDMDTGVPYEVTDPLNEKVTTTFDSGRIKKISPARTGHDITYVYDPATGDLTNVNYANASMADIVYEDFNRLGIPQKITDASGLRAFGYDLDDDLSLKWERLDVSFGSLRYLNRAYESTAGSVGRYASFALHSTSTSQSSTFYKQAYGYEANTGRLDTIAGYKTGFSAKADYNYRSDANLLNQLIVTNGAGTTTYQTNSYGYESDRDLPGFVQSRNGSNALLSRFDYEYDGLGRRTAAYATGKHVEKYPHTGLLRTFDYNERSEVTGVTEYFADSITHEDYAIRGRVWKFGYDNAGNRTMKNDDTWTMGNASNQLTKRVVPGEVNASGIAVAGSGFSVDRITLKATTSGDDSYVTYDQIETASTQYQPARRYQDFYYADLDVNNSSGPVYAALSVYATDDSNDAVALEAPAGSRYVPPAQQDFTYDADGNLTSDERWFYTYDSENRLYTMETRAAAYGIGVPRRKLEFGYDYLGRRFSKKVYSWNSTSASWLLTSHLNFVYDGWNLIAELDALSNNAIIKRYYWGLDLSGTDGGAGGAGGLYAMVDNSTGTEYQFFAQYDGNGNLVGWSGTSGQPAATYEYSPFGEMLAEDYAGTTYQDQLGRSGFRFSTNYYDAETGLYYYGYRYYNPQLGRFINRDPIGFAGGSNLYGFVGNNTPNAVDVRGLAQRKNPNHKRAEVGWTEALVRQQTQTVSTIADSNSYTDFFGSGQGLQFKLFGGNQFNNGSGNIGSFGGGNPSSSVSAVSSVGAPEIAGLMSLYENGDIWTVAAQIERFQSPIHYYALGGADIAGGVVAETAGSIAIPGFGEALDLREATDPSASDFSANLAVVSLSASTVTAGAMLPNSSVVTRNFRKISRLLTSKIPDKPDFSWLSRVATNRLVDTNTIRFAQDTAGKNINGISSFSDGRPIRGLIDDLSSGAVSPLDVKPIRVFQRDGLTFTLDNRRLLAAQKAGVKVNTVPATAAEVANEAFKFTTKSQGQFIGIKGALK